MKVSDIQKALLERALEAIPEGAAIAVLTHDDILTLKLLRDWYVGERQRYPDEKHGPRHTELTLDTLNRILKQVG